MSQPDFRVGVDADDAPPALTPSQVFASPTKEEASSGSVLEGLRDALSAPVVTEPVTLRVPGRPGVTIRCHTRMSQEERTAWRKRSTKRSRRPGKEEEVDEMGFACLVIANTCEAVSFEGIDAADSEGTPLTFRHAQLWQMVGSSDPASAIRKLFGVDAHVLIASGEVLLESGFDDDLQASDPT